MNKKKFEKVLLEKEISFNNIKLKKTIGNVKKLDGKFKRQLKDLPKKAKSHNQLTKLSLITAEKISNKW